jgi:hypothetical protein
MNTPPYPVTASDEYTFSFESVSEHKTIRKIIAYQPVQGSQLLYNLALLDQNEDGTLDDLVVSNNQDMPRILATVIATMGQFFRRNKSAIVLFQGSTPARTRLYRIVIAKNSALFEGTFIVKGLLENKFENFTANRPYEVFSVSLKKAKTDEGNAESENPSRNGFS